MIVSLFFASLDPVREMPELYLIPQSKPHRAVHQKPVSKTKLSLTPHNHLLYGGHYYAWHYDVTRN